MATRNAPTLETLLESADIRMDAPAMRWMIVTWDVACIDSRSNKYYRFLLADNAYLGLYNKRNTQAFSPTSPSRGTIGGFVQAGSSPLSQALKKDMEKAKEYRPVCQPLAVDCSEFAGEVDSPADLLDAIKDNGGLGRRVLAHINRTRQTAMVTHLASGWSYDFPGQTDRDLWSGA